MLSKITSPIRNQSRISAFPTPSRMVFPFGIARKSAATSVETHATPFADETAEFDVLPPPDNRVRRHTGEREGEPFHPKNTTPLGMAAHDLRHPAAALVIYSELLAHSVGQKASEQQRELVDSIHSVSKFLLHLLDDTLDLARAESGTVQLCGVRSTVVTILAQCVAMSRPLAERKQMRLSFSQEGKPQLVLLDAIKISKVFNNLIQNAIQYCPPGARIKVRLSRGEGAVLVTVSDNGPGIDPAGLRTLFTPFQKNRRRGDSDQSGTGLGLAIAKHAVDLHGGRIWVDSEVGKGTTFYVSLPAAANPVKKS